MTDRLYYTDATVTTFTAQVTAISDDRRAVSLSRSAFYPTSGGQPHDVGTLAGIAVTDVTETDGEVIHHLVTPLPEPIPEAIVGEVDWARRLDHMQQHSGQHLLSAVLEDEFGWPTVSVHIGRDGCALDLRTDDVTAEAVSAVLSDVEQRVNLHIAENRPVVVSFEEADTAQGLRKGSERSGTLRVVTIEGLDRNACGGTHVSRLGEIGVILTRRVERTRGTTRVEFRCGLRAVARAREDAALLQQTASAFSAAVEDVPMLVSRLQGTLRDTEKSERQLREQLTALHARERYAETAALPSGLRVAVDEIEGDPVASRQLFAQQFVLNHRAIYLAHTQLPPALLLAASPDSGIDAGRLLKETLLAVGGKGGGSPRLAQGSAPSGDQADAARARLLELLSAHAANEASD